MPLDINLSPLYRIQGNDQTDMPGVLALQPPKTAARGREQDRLLVYLVLTGNAVITTSEYRKLAEDTAAVYYKTPRAVTSALRAAADSLNRTLLERNMSTSTRGQYTLAWLGLAAVRESQCIFSLSGPMHAYWFGTGESRHFFEPTISGKGLGSSQAINIHYAQTDLAANHMLLFCGRLPNAWATPLEDAQPSSFDAMRRRLTSLTGEDLNAVLFQTSEGTGAINTVRGASVQKIEAAPVPEEQKLQVPQADEVPALHIPDDELPATPEPEPTPGAGAHLLQPSTYNNLPPQAEEPKPVATPLDHLPHKTTPREFPASIPRAKPKTELPDEPPVLESALPEPVINETPLQSESTFVAPPQTEGPREPSPLVKQAAKATVNVMHAFRTGSASLGERFRAFLPRLLPAENPEAVSVSASALMGFIAVLVPLIVVTLAWAMYWRYGRNEQYDAYFNQAQQLKQQALALSSPVEKRVAWENVLQNVVLAEQHNVTDDTLVLKQEAQTNIDQLLGIYRLQFNPAFSTPLGINVSRMAASENDLYLLNAENGEVLRAFPSGNGGFQRDDTFRCKPGDNNNAGPIVDILTLPITNFYGASVLGIDASGNLLYCKPGEAPQSGLLTAPDTNWSRITGFALDAGNLYVLDAPARAVWVYNGKEGVYTDRPYFFFGQQTPTQDVIDFTVTGDVMHLLHADGRISTCSFSRIDSNLSKCEDPLPRSNPSFPAYGENDPFTSANFTQMLFAAPPDPSILLLDADSQRVMRFAPRTMELQNQFQSAAFSNPIPRGPVGAVAVSPDHVLYLAVNDQVYFAVNMP